MSNRRVEKVQWEIAAAVERSLAIPVTAKRIGRFAVTISVEAIDTDSPSKSPSDYQMAKLGTTAYFDDSKTMHDFCDEVFQYMVDKEAEFTKHKPKNGGDK
jgi:hypothetical protein